MDETLTKNQVKHLRNAKSIVQAYQKSLYNYLLLINSNPERVENLFLTILLEATLKFKKKSFKNSPLTFLLKLAHTKSEKGIKSAFRATNEFEEKVNALSMTQKEILYLKEKISLSWEDVGLILGKDPELLYPEFNQALFALQEEPIDNSRIKESCKLTRKTFPLYLYAKTNDPIRTQMRPHLTACNPCLNILKSFQETLLDITDWEQRKINTEKLEEILINVSQKADEKRIRIMPFLIILFLGLTLFGISQLPIKEKLAEFSESLKQKNPLEKRGPSKNKKETQHENRNQEVNLPQFKKTTSQNKKQTESSFLFDEDPLFEIPAIEKNAKNPGNTSSSNKKNDQKKKVGLQEVVGSNTTDPEVSVDQHITQGGSDSPSAQNDDHYIIPHADQNKNLDTLSANFNPNARFNAKNENSKTTPSDALLPPSQNNGTSTQKGSSSDNTDLKSGNTRSLTLQKKGSDSGTYRDETFGFLEKMGGLPPIKRRELINHLKGLSFNEVYNIAKKLSPLSKKDFTREFYKELEKLKNKKQNEYLANLMPQIECGQDSSDPLDQFVTNVTQTAENLKQAKIPDLTLFIDTPNFEQFKMAHPIASYLLEEKIKDMLRKSFSQPQGTSTSHAAPVSPSDQVKLLTLLNRKLIHVPNPTPISPSAMGTKVQDTHVPFFEPSSNKWMKIVRIIQKKATGSQVLYVRFREALLSQEAPYQPSEMNMCPLPLSFYEEEEITQFDDLDSSQ